MYLFIWSLYSLSSHSHSQVWLLNLPRQEWDERCLHWSQEKVMTWLCRWRFAAKDFLHWKNLSLRVWLLNLPRQEWDERCLHWSQEKAMTWPCRWGFAAKDFLHWEHLSQQVISEYCRCCIQTQKKCNTMQQLQFRYDTCIAFIRTICYSTKVFESYNMTYSRKYTLNKNNFCIGNIHFSTICF